MIALDVRAPGRPQPFSTSFTTGPTLIEESCGGPRAFLSWPKRKLFGAAMAKSKKFLLSPEEIHKFAPDLGGCIATDRITVDGMPVGYMYREQPNNSLDSGWRFLAGDETSEYMNDSDNHDIYDINTVANYDPDIIPFLDLPIGIELERPVGEAVLRPLRQY